MKLSWNGIRQRIDAMTVRTKLYVLAASFVFLIGLMVLVAIHSERKQRAFQELLNASLTASRNIERANGLIYAAVMESRGVYMSPDRDSARRYGQALLQRLDDLADVVNEWRLVVRGDDARQFASFKLRIEQFIEFRKELVRRGSTMGPAAGRAWGDNEENRAVRTALNQDLESLSAIYALRTLEIRRIAATNLQASYLMIGLGVFFVGLAGALIVLFRRAILDPILDIANTTNRIAKGKIKLVVPHAKRSDEIGGLARAVEAFQDSAFRVIELERHEQEMEQANEAMARERSLLEEQVTTGKWQLDAAVRNMPQGVIMLDRTAKVLVVNEQYRQLYGVPARIAKPGSTLREILDHRVASGAFSGDLEEYLASVMKRISARKPTVADVELADGRVIRVSERPMDGGGWVATHEDYTAQHRAERTLERTERFLMALLENVPEAVVAKDAKTLQYVFVNRATEKLFGIGRGQIIGKTPRELFPETTGELLERFDREMLDGTSGDTQTVHTIETPTNQSRRIAVRRLPIAMEGRPSQFLLSIIEDCTKIEREAA
ncbi:PAS-domain containing protein [Bradyrhizobium roseum]|uniref:PAS-domain containing protein n=1 Tax=Bradyrhizobium roseum TaxID=3056648 RepID=UPI002617BC4A|nr:PAS-domain containing protein [Bradyrhizobium roseus]WKA28292.1 PAS-domain containing protein [Bradyrhizobium roseus]